MQCWMFANKILTPKAERTFCLAFRPKFTVGAGLLGKTSKHLLSIVGIRGTIANGCRGSARKKKHHENLSTFEVEYCKNRCIVKVGASRILFFSVT